MATKDKYHIQKIYDTSRTPDRNERVLDKIALYFNNNIPAITDGIIHKVPKISAADRNLIGKEYQISSSEWSMVKQSPEFKNMKQLASILNLGLIMSYMETKNKQFLIYLFILHYSSVYQKYMTNGSHNPLIMKYTIDTSDDRTDFKKYNSSLIQVVNKKIDTFLKNHSDIVNKTTITDKEIVTLIQSSKNRLNEMFKNLYGRYKANYHADDIKVMMEYSKTDDGKHVLSMQNVFERLKEVTVESLYYPSTQVLDYIGLSIKNTAEFKNRTVIVKHFSASFQRMSKASGMIIDKWTTQNINKLNMHNFKTTFITSMMKGRNIKHIYDIIDDIIEDMLNIEKQENDNNYNRLTLRNYIYKYLVINIYQCSSKVFTIK